VDPITVFDLRQGLAVAPRRMAMKIWVPSSPDNILSNFEPIRFSRRTVFLGWTTLLNNYVRILYFVTVWNFEETPKNFALFSFNVTECLMCNKIRRAVPFFLRKFVQVSWTCSTCKIFGIFTENFSAVYLSLSAQHCFNKPISHIEVLRWLYLHC
jgi:hypothetical protein